jgi:hypothetical protein
MLWATCVCVCVTFDLAMAQVTADMKQDSSRQLLHQG